MHDLRLALRALQRRPGFTMIAVLMLALGIGATTATFSIVHGVLLRPLPYAAPAALVRLYHANPREARDAGFSRQDWPEVRAAELPFSELAGYFHQPGRMHETINVNGRALRLASAYVSGSFFRTLGVAPLLGGTITEAHDVEHAANYVVLSEAAWQAHFGGARDVVGRTLTISGEPFTVLGVMPRLFQFPAREVQLWAPLALLDTTRVGGGRDFRWIDAVGRLRPGASGDAAAAALAPTLARLAAAYPESNAGWTAARVTPLKESIVGGVRTELLVLLSAVALVLLIACANLANLLLARASGRSRELAVRAALGARGRRLARQILVENLSLALLGGACGVMLAIWLVDALVRLGSEFVTRPDEVGVNGAVLGFALAITLLTGALASVLPVLRAARAQPADALREGARGGTVPARTRARSLLVAAETALAVLLLVGAMLLTRSLWQLMQRDPGFEPDGVIALSVNVPEQRFSDPGELVDYRERFFDHLREVPGVEQIAGSTRLPLTSATGEPFGGWETVRPDGTAREFAPAGGVFYISNGYFGTLGTRILAGREFAAADRLTDESTVVPIVINALAARLYWAGERAVGQYLRAEDSPLRLQVIGVVEPVRMESMSREPLPALYLPWQVGPRVAVHAFIRPAAADAQLMPRLRAAVQAFDAEMAVGQLQPLTAVIGSDLAQPRFYTLLLATFAAAAVLLAGLGIYGVIAYAVTLRGHEIGVRLALGALRRDVVSMVVGQALRVAGVGLAIGLLAAYWASQLLAGMLHGVSPRDPVAFGAVPLVLLLVTVAAAALPALRAAGTDPMVAFRNE